MTYEFWRQNGRSTFFFFFNIDLCVTVYLQNSKVERERRTLKLEFGEFKNYSGMR